jgi:hypothetical protein
MQQLSLDQSLKSKFINATESEMTHNMAATSSLFRFRICFSLQCCVLTFFLYLVSRTGWASLQNSKEVIHCKLIHISTGKTKIS